MKEEQGHHIWCNYFMRPVKGCKMCEGLRARYPDDGLTPNELAKKHFPEAKFIPPVEGESK